MKEEDVKTKKDDIISVDNNKDYVENIEENSSKDSVEDIVFENEKLKKELQESRIKLLEQNMTIELLKKQPQMICEVTEIFEEQEKEKKAIIKIPNGNKFLVNVVTKEEIKSGDSVVVDKNNLNIIDKLSINTEFDVEKFVIIEKPKLKWHEVGGLEKEVEEIKEVIELPIKEPKLFDKIGIEPPKGILLHGPPGTGKTLLAKAVASESNATFIELVGSELVQKFIGEGAKLVREVFNLAREKSPAILFIDEIDSIAAKRIEIGTSGEREVQRTFMQFLAEIDGFKALSNVKVIGATNRIDILDPAILRPGRLDRLIEIKIPSDVNKVKEIIKIHSKRMPLNKDVDLALIAKEAIGMSGAELKSVCTEAGYFSIRNKRSVVKQSDFIKAIEKVKIEEKEDETYKNIFA